jgi:hypothetical protein
MTAKLDDLLHDPAEPAGSRVPALDGRRLSMQEQAQALAADTMRAGWRRFRKACQHPAGMIHGLMAEKPPSVTEQVAYAEGRKWVTAGHDDGIADVAGSLYHRFVGFQGVAYHDAMAAIYQKPFRMGVYLLIFAVVTVPVLHFWGWLGWLTTYAVLRVIVFPLAVAALRPKGVGR